MTMDQEQHHENVGAYVLGALPELEAEVFERHVMGCDACRDELDRLRTAVDALPRSVEPLAPPVSLKESLMSVVREEAAERSPVRRRRLLPRIVRVPTLVRMPAAAAWVSAAFLLAVGVAGGWGISRLADSGERTLSAQVDRSRLPNGRASLTLQDDGSDGAVLSVHGLPQTVGNRVYQVWLRRGRDVAPSTLFTVRADGSGAAGIPESLRDVDEVMVTREPAGGATTPGELPVLRVRV